MDFYASCAGGLESLLAAELEELDEANVSAERGLVRFRGEVRDALRACLWSRLATRIVAVLAEGVVSAPHELEELCQGVPWERTLDRGVTAGVFCSGACELFPRSSRCAKLVRGAIDSAMREHLGYLAPEGGGAPDLRIQVHLSDASEGARVIVGVDLAGEPLWQRGYERYARRSLPALRADMAAALLMLGGWRERCAAGEEAAPTLAALFSGTGALVAEAAAMALDVAPGLLRGRWGFEAWPQASAQSWRRQVREAQMRREAAAGRAIRLVAADPREGSRAHPQAVLRAMGLDVSVEVLSQKAMAEGSLDLGEGALLAADLSWARDEGQSLAAQAVLASLCATLEGRVPGAVLAKDRDASLLFGEPLSATALVQGRDRLTALSYANAALASSKADVAGGTPRLLEADSAAFAHLLATQAAERVEEAEEEQVSCYRLYDRELPTYNLAIDLYQGAKRTPGRWLVVSEFEAPASVDASLARRRLFDAVNVARRLLQVDALDVFAKVRRHAKGGSQYRSGSARSSRAKPRRVAGAELPPGSALVEEGGLLFEVDLEHHLDTGIFLDDRDIRSRIREEAKATGGGRFLNLFSYTGTSTVYAADGGCSSTTSVDLSASYLAVAERNLRRNGFLGEAEAEGEAPARPRHRFVRMDAMEFISRERSGRRRWDLIWCGPPTFSNSKATGRSFDVQADHLDLIIGLSRLLARDGLGIFCCNLRTFEPDVERLGRAGVALEDITESTIPFDFSRERSPHRCYLVRRA